MKCEHCNKEISDTLIASHLGRIMGQKSGGARKVDPKTDTPERKKNREAVQRSRARTAAALKRLGESTV